MIPFDNYKNNAFVVENLDYIEVDFTNQRKIFLKIYYLNVFFLHVDMYISIYISTIYLARDPHHE